MLRRGCLIGVVGILGLCVIACGVGWFAVLPAFRRNIDHGVRNAVGTEVAQHIPSAAGGAPGPGTYVISQDSLLRSIQSQVSSDNVNDLVIRISPSGLAFGFTSQGQDTTYAGVPAAENGRLVMRHMSADNRFLRFLLSPDTLGEAIAEGVNTYLDRSHLRLQSVQLGNGQMTLTTAAAT